MDQIRQHVTWCLLGYFKRTPYRDAVDRAFGSKVDYAMLIKSYSNERDGEARYSPSVCVAARKEPIMGNPDEAHVSTSFIERQNLTMRMQMRRFTRLTNAFSKKVENHAHAIALHYFHYNWCRKHQTIKTTPAIHAGIADRQWTMLDFVEMLEAEEAANGGRITDYLPATSK